MLSLEINIRKKMISVLSPHLTFADLITFFSLGKNPSLKFEKKLCEKFAVKYALTYSSGRAGLYHILKANNIKNKNVLITAYTCCVVTEAIIQSGNKIIFVDTNKGSFNSTMLENHINKYRADLAAVIITNLYGISSYEKLKYLADRKNFLVIIDNALSPGDILNAPKELYDYIFISSGVRKPFTTLGGGVVFANDWDKYKTLLDYTVSNRKNIKPSDKLKQFLFLFLFFLAFRKLIYPFTSFVRRRTDLLQPFFNEKNNDIYSTPPEYFFDMSSFQKRIGINQLEKIYDLLDRRKKISNLYYTLLSPHFNFVREYWKLDTPYSHVPFLHPQRDELQAYLLNKKIDTEKYFDYAVPNLEPYQGNEACLNVSAGFPNADHISNQIINLPVNVELNEKTIIKIVNEIIQFGKNPSVKFN